MKLGAVLVAGLLVACSGASLKPGSQAQHPDEPACLAACEAHDEQCPKMFAAFPERGAIECPASHADCLKACRRTSTAAGAQPLNKPAAASSTTKEAKLRELKRLYEEGLVTDEVYRARQLAILSEP